MKKKFTKTHHIIFDAFDCNKKFLNDEKFILEILFEIPKIIKMRILSGPNLVRDYDKINPGITGFAIIDKSHISIHTFVKTREIYIDVFSCQKFDYQKIKKYLFSKLKVKPEKVETLEIKYPWEK
ncbi:MAG: hypothetical protein COX34_01995 [Candidatus Nealsonbacteria bacterium CG23_combo_of_CG06-09_8_20_14_all_36_12]|uniref:S-adenosylmethionine decarboxylase proenzyme n=1 Tax=Candidatus Nealsonbacteria bacterium CG23_combo_of_CG06-09_8_20_14_all_36_12 TaxID=1974718 RepID=A0A2G9Z2B0_9BACT|nr:MAG: hypothetical protein COX34_01995 [Candidatus Nealsonbacteria bacterium CG23_combo_of_CG06-09_8_20_14_all_36_12]